MSRVGGFCIVGDNTVRAQEWSGVVAAVPPHCAVQVVQLARGYVQMWLDAAQITGSAIS